MILDLVFINRLAQGLESLDFAKKWFNELQEDEKEIVLENLIHFIQQGGIVAQDIPLFLDKVSNFSQIKLTSTPLKMIENIGIKKIKGTLALISVLKKFKRLPAKEKSQAFLILLGIMNYSYLTYKEDRNNDDKWWYKDLSKTENYPKFRE